MGSKNKIPKSLQADLKECYDRLGGVDGLVGFCKRNDKNKERFYGWVIGLLPKEVNLTGHVTHSLDKLSDQELIEIINGQATKAIDIESDDDTPSLPPSNHLTP